MKLLSLAVAILPLVAADPTCNVDDGQKQDCGVVGTNQQECENAGCCWSAVDPNPNNTPWCFRKSGGGGGATCPLLGNTTGAPFSDAEISTMRKYFLANINIDGKGGVVASPDHNTPGGSYYYHWERDGALSMEALLQTAGSVSEVESLMNGYAGWVTARQTTSDPHGQSVLTEPKYMLPDGEVFTGPWCRPQDDGPGLRAKTLIGFANALGAADQRHIDTVLWPAIRTDLDYVADNWSTPSTPGCDLWEEIRSDDFFWNRFTMRAALMMGAEFAAKQKDQARSSKYAASAKTISSTLESHYQNGFVIETQSRQKDAAVICAFNDGYMGDGVFSPTSSEVAGTVKTLNELFCGSYVVNQADSKAGVPGVLYGRYEGDHYAGGNPWILLSAAVAELLYRGATEVHELLSNQSKLSAARLDALDYDLWEGALHGGASGWLKQEPAALAAAMAQAGDGVLLRIREHVKDTGFHLTEQLDRNSGKPMSAADLTWSYATVLKAAHARKMYVSSK